jgi:RHS repeat-associated protein
VDLATIGHRSTEMPSFLAAGLPVADREKQACSRRTSSWTTTSTNPLQYEGLFVTRGELRSTETGRFLSVDPVLEIEKAMHNPQMWNRYAYVTNNPMRYTDPTGKSLWETVIRVAEYFGREGHLVERIAEISKNKALPRVTKALDGIKDGKRVVVVEGAEKDAKNLARALDPKGKVRGPEKSFGYPEGYHPASGPYSDVHVQTADATKAAGVAKGVLSIIVPFSMAAAANRDATPGEIGSAAAWDVAKAIDPIFITDIIEHVTGANEYSEPPSPPE